MTLSPPATQGGIPRWLLKAVGITLALTLFLGILILLGKMAWQNVRHDERYTVAFADIDCTPPAGQTRADFLDEVQYLAEMPGQLGLLEDSLSERLARAFLRHPRVEKVVQVVLIRPRQIRIELVYRTPVLAVRWAGQLRAVDGQGILLPKETPTRGLPVFSGKATPPGGPAGTPWGDAAVEAAARKLVVAQAMTDPR